MDEEQYDYADVVWSIMNHSRHSHHPLRENENDTTQGGEELTLKCPVCNSQHEWKSYVAEDLKDLQIYNSGNGSLCCKKCSKGSSDHYAVASCGHVLCFDDFESSGGKGGESRLENCGSKCTVADDSVERRYSHGSRAVLLSSKKGTENSEDDDNKATCPICWEDFSNDGEAASSSSASYTMAALPCGHLICNPDFVKLGGKIGDEALLSLEEMTRRRTERLGRLQAEHGRTTAQLIQSLSSRDDVHHVEITLALLVRAFPCHSGPENIETFFRQGGIAATIQTMTRFPESPVVQQTAAILLCNMVCSEHQPPPLQTQHSKSIIDAGVLPVCLNALRNEQSVVPVLDSTCKLLSKLFSNFQVENLPQLESIVRALLQVLERNPNVAVLQGSILYVFLCLAGGDEGGRYDVYRQKMVMELKVLPAIETSMRRFQDDDVLQANGIGALCHLSFTQKTRTQVRNMGAVQLCCTAMEQYPYQWSLQRNACNLLWVMAEHSNNKELKSVEDTMLSCGAVNRLYATMTAFSDNMSILTQSFSALSNFVSKKKKRLASEVCKSGCIDLVAKSIDKFKSLENGPMLGQAANLVGHLSESNDNDIRFALTTNTDLIPALQEVADQCYQLCMGPMMGMSTTMNVEPFAVMGLDESVHRVLTRIGCHDTNVIGDDDYDYDQDLDEDEIEDPPFNVTSILDKDLTQNPPGWYKHRGFNIDYDRSEELSKMKKYKKKASFFIPGQEPQVGQTVAIRVSIPYGGRGYLYGDILDVGPAPSDEELRASDSPIFEKPCPCPRPDCELKTADRQSLLKLFGALHGQEITAKVSLKSVYTKRKLRFAPLPNFFQGEGTEFDAVLRWYDTEQQWHLKMITKHGEERKPATGGSNNNN